MTVVRPELVLLTLSFFSACEEGFTTEGTVFTEKTSVCLRDLWGEIGFG